MHEGVFTDKIVEAILIQLKDVPDRKIQSVTVKVGEVYHLVLESVLMHFDIAAKGTALEGVELRLIEENVQVRCQKCHRSGPVEDHHMMICSFCHSLEVTPIAGKSITIESIQFEK